MGHLVDLTLSRTSHFHGMSLVSGHSFRYMSWGKKTRRRSKVQDYYLERAGETSGYILLPFSSKIGKRPKVLKQGDEGMFLVDER